MGQVKRQIGVVIGLTVILTFPVTVVSGAGSQKHSEHAVRTSLTHWKFPPQAARISGVEDHDIPSSAARRGPRH
jgi:hypothetical protein